MFPIRDENPIYHKAIVTYTIIGLNVLLWFFIQGMGFNPALVKSICTFGAIPGELLGRVPPGTQIPIARGIACVIDGQP